MGYRVLRGFARRHGAVLASERFGGRFGIAVVAGHSIGLLEPATFMNASGEAVASALAHHPELDRQRDLVVVYDDIDLPPGRIRIRPHGGAGGHRGLASVVEEVGDSDFARLRFGVGRPGAERSAADYVLEDFSAAEEAWLEQRFTVAVEALTVLFELGMVAVMDRFNAEAPPDD